MLNFRQLIISARELFHSITSYDHSKITVSNIPIHREFKYVKDQIQRVPHNESTWNYLRGILSDSNKYAYPGLVEFCEGLYKNNVRSFYLMGFMVECWQDGIEKAGSESEKAELLGKAVDFCESLAEDHDTIRVEYWKYVSRSLSFQHSDVKVVEATS